MKSWHLVSIMLAIAAVGAVNVLFLKENEFVAFLLLIVFAVTAIAHKKPVNHKHSESCSHWDAVQTKSRHKDIGTKSWDKLGKE